MPSFTDRIKLLRETKGLSQSAVSKGTGITPRYYQYLEYGEREPGLSKLIALADFYDVSIDYLVGRSNDSTPLSFSFNWQSTFRKRLSNLLPNLNTANMESTDINVGRLEAIAYDEAPLNFYYAYCIAEELGIALDYLLSLSDDY